MASNPLEKEIERRLRTRIEARGGRCLKWVCPGWNGVPDRMCLLPGGRVIFVETKRPQGSRTAKLQEKWAEILTGLGFPHYFIFTYEAIEDLMEEIDRRK